MTKSKDALEVIIETKDLVHVLNFTSSIVAKRNITQEISNIKLTASLNGVLTIGATDMDLYLNQTIGAEVISQGETIVSTQTIYDVARKISDTKIKLKQDYSSSRLNITGLNCYFKLLTLPTVQFPMIEDNINSDHSLQVSCRDLARIIEYTNFAMSNEDTRYNLNGIYLYIKDNELGCVATDGHRLSVASTKLSERRNDKFGVIIPRKSAFELLKIVKDKKYAQGALELFLSNTRIKFVFKNLIMISKLIDKTFPDHSLFVPKDSNSKLVVSKTLLLDAINRVSTVTIDKFRAVKISIQNKGVLITASGETKGDAGEIIEFSNINNNLCNFSGAELSIGINPKYINDVLNTISGSQVSIFFKNHASPILIKTLANPDDYFIIMPIKI